MKVLHEFSYKHLNRLLLALIIVINSYILLLPLLPKIQLVLHKNKLKAVSGLPYKTNLDSGSTNNKRAEIPKDERLVIPKIALDEKIYQGDSQYLVNKGIWARPKTSTPPKDSNTVLVGHRFTYDGPATLYNLDKVAVGDKIVVYWGGKEYDYEVSETKVVAASAVEIEQASPNPKLTIYTCTPLWSAKDRLVVIATPIGAVND